MKDLADRIKFARVNAHLTQSELARQIGVSRASVSAWEQGLIKNLRGDHLNALARATGRDVSFFVSDKGATGGTNLALASINEQRSDRRYSYLRLSRYREHQREDGTIGVTCDDTDTMTVPRSWLGFSGSDAPNCAWLTMPGTAMADRIPSEATIVIDCDAVIPQQGYIYAFDDGMVLRVAYLARLPNNRIEIRCHDDSHPAEHRDLADVAILGRAIWYAARL